jgi:hypothetical protein
MKKQQESGVLGIQQRRFVFIIEPLQRMTKA